MERCGLESEEVMPKKNSAVEELFHREQMLRETAINYANAIKNPAFSALATDELRRELRDRAIVYAEAATIIDEDAEIESHE